MSRIGKKPVEIPANTTVTIADGIVKVVGPKGELSRSFGPEVSIEVVGTQVVLAPAGYKKNGGAILWGTYSSHISNMVAGVNTPYQKKLIVEGVGFKANVQGETLVLELGFSHDIKVAIPKGLTVTAEKNEITVTGIDKEMVGKFTADIRARKKPEPYKGKGIRYHDEVVRRKQGKKSV